MIEARFPGQASIVAYKVSFLHVKRISRGLYSAFSSLKGPFFLSVVGPSAAISQLLVP